VISPGVPPTALSSPIRRVRSAIRPPASTATLAMASRAARNAPGERTCCSSRTSRPSAVAIPCHEAIDGAAGLLLLP